MYNNPKRLGTSLAAGRGIGCCRKMSFSRPNAGSDSPGITICARIPWATVYDSGHGYEIAIKKQQITGDIGVSSQIEQLVFETISVMEDRFYCVDDDGLCVGRSIAAFIAAAGSVAGCR